MRSGTLLSLFSLVFRSPFSVQSRDRPSARFWDQAERATRLIAGFWDQVRLPSAGFWDQADRAARPIAGFWDQVLALTAGF